MNMARKGILILAMVAMAASCIVNDEFAPKQRTQIENYLNKNGLEYVITSDSAYVHLGGNKFAPEIPDTREAAKGDKVTFNFEAYTFSSSPASTPYYTNKRYLAEAISEDLNTTYWNFEPRVVKLGAGEIINSLEEAFEGSMKGDSLAVFLTSSIAYGESGMGTVPANTAIMFVLTVEDITE